MNIYDSELAALLGIQPINELEEPVNQKHQAKLTRRCESCHTEYTRTRTPMVRWVEFGRCAACAFAAYLVEQSQRTLDRVLH